MKKFVVGESIPSECKENLLDSGFRIVTLPPFGKLQKGVCTHADMLIFRFRDTIVTSRDYYCQHKEVFAEIGLKVLTDDRNIMPDYPMDVPFNVVMTSDGQLFSKADATSAIIKNMSKTQVNVKQGYTACSTCKVTDGAFITSDTGLFKAYSQYGIDCLLVGKEDIVLDGYGCGFIGGASAVDDECVYFFGNVMTHTDGEKMIDFIEKRGKKVVCLGDGRLTDVGGGFVIE